MEWCAVRMLHILFVRPFGQTARDLAGPVIAQQAWLVAQDDLMTTKSSHGQLNGFRYICGLHVRAEFSSDDVAALVV